MLAFKFKDFRDRIVYPVSVQPKLDGIRALYCNGNMQSRDEHLWHPSVLAPIIASMHKMPDDWVYDGELYVHGWSLQQINSAVAVKRVEAHPLIHKVQYHIFDGFPMNDPNMAFTQRMACIKTAHYNLKPYGIDINIKVVDTEVCSSPTRCERLYSDYRAQGYEGIMYREPNSSYGHASLCTNQENRWSRLLKRKEWMDEWFPVLTINYGEGKYTDKVGSLVCQLPCGATFDAGSGLSDQERIDFIERPPKEAHIQYERLSDDGLPLKPTVLETR